jgi:hypothetical protein
MENIQNNIVMLQNSHTAQSLSDLSPARSDMAVVEPVAAPILSATPNMVLRICLKRNFGCYFLFV